MMIVCDWGSSRLRAWLVDSEGRVSDRYESEMGVKIMAGSYSEARGCNNPGLHEATALPYLLSSTGNSENLLKMCKPLKHWAKRLLEYA